MHTNTANNIRVLPEPACNLDVLYYFKCNCTYKHFQCLHFLHKTMGASPIISQSFRTKNWNNIKKSKKKNLSRFFESISKKLRPNRNKELYYFEFFFLFCAVKIFYFWKKTRFRNFYIQYFSWMIMLAQYQAINSLFSSFENETKKDYEPHDHLNSPPNLLIYKTPLSKLCRMAV